MATGLGAETRLRAEKAAMGHTADRLGVTCDPRAVADAVVEPAEAGATAVILRPTSDEPDPEGFVRFAAEQVRPLVP